MHTDLFSALLNRENRRGHPILAAMLYSFCPTAARWWIAGADPEPIFDPVWQAIKDWNSGTNLTEQLEKYDLGKVIDVVGNYVEDVEQYRKDHEDSPPSPELSPSFKGGQIPRECRFESESGIQNMGGNWDNLFVYIRTWAFLLDDWRQSIHIDKGAKYNLKLETVALTLPDYRQPVHFETLACGCKLATSPKYASVCWSSEAKWICYALRFWVYPARTAVLTDKTQRTQSAQSKNKKI